MTQYRIIQTIPHNPDYVDEDKPIKDILTDFVNKNFLKYNNNEMSLLRIIYKVISPILNRYGLFLVFKGGNIMRLINNNLKEYLQPIESEIIEKVFEPYLKQSDNDFTVYIDPNIPNYNQFIDNVTDELYEALNKIRDKIVNDPDQYFDLFSLSEKEIEKAFNELDKELDAKDVRLQKTYNKIVLLQNPNNLESDTLVLEDLGEQESFIFNSKNKSISFEGGSGELIRFFLLRSKVNFKINCEKQVAGELIDISIPHRDDSSFKKYNSSLKFRNFLANNIHQAYDRDYNFTYYTVNLDYIIHDLFRILYRQSAAPWDNNKYQKRIARLIYFIFVKELDDHQINIVNYRNILDSFKDFIVQVSQPKSKITNDIIWLQKIYDETVRLRDSKPPQSKFKTYINNLKTYSVAIIKICVKLIAYILGLGRIDNEKLYELDIV